MVGIKGHLLSFENVCVLICPLSHLYGHPGAKVGPWGTRNTFSSAPSAERGDKRHIRGCLQGGLAITRLESLPFSV